MGLPSCVMTAAQTRLERQVVLHRQAADEVELLEHQTDFRASPIRQLAFTHAIESILAAANAAAIHLVQPSDQVQQGALATARLPINARLLPGISVRSMPCSTGNGPWGVA